MTTIKTSVLATAAALTAFASGAFAMDVNVYGVVDLGMHWTNSNTSKHAFVMDSGITKGSRVGMRGKENLGGGYSAIFNLETGFNADTGEFDNTSNRLFNRGASLGISAPWGKVEMGRLGALGSGVTGSIFLNGFTPFGNLYKESQALQIINHQVMRADNMVRFESASMAGVKLYAEYSNGVSGDDSVRSSQKDRFAAVGVTYQNGPFGLVFVADNYFYNNVDNAYFGRDDSQTYNLGARYRLNDVTFYAAYQYGHKVEKLGNQMKKPGSKDATGNTKKDGSGNPTETKYDNQGFNSNAFVVGLKAKALGGELKLQGGYARGTSNSDSAKFEYRRSNGTLRNPPTYKHTRVKADVWQMAVGYNYPLSKSTYLYASAAYVDRTYKENGVKVEGATKTDTVKSAMFGLCHSF